MKRDELIRTLKELDIPENAFHFDGPGAGECYCIEANQNGWVIYYSERGQRTIISTYASENEANEKFLQKLKVIFQK